MSRWRGRIALLLAAAIAASGCTRSDTDAGATPTEVRIGLLAPLSGPDRALGEDARRGAQFAGDLINGFYAQIPLPLAPEAGLPNLGNARIRVTVSDSAKSPAGTEAARLAGEGAVGLVGATTPDPTLEASLRAERLPVPFVNGDSSVSFLAERGLDWFFHTGPTVRTAGEAYFSLLKKQEALGRLNPQTSKLAILHADDKDGNDVATIVRELAEEGGYTVDKDLAYAPDRAASSLGPLVDQLVTAKPDVVFLAPNPIDVPALVQAMDSRAYHPPAAMSFGIGIAEQVKKAGGQSSTGLCRETSWSREVADRNPAAQQVSKLYEDKYKTPMTEEAASSFTAVYILALAIDAAGSTEPRLVRSSLLSLNLPGQDTIMPWDGVRFDESHQNVGASAVIEQYAGGSFHPVFPFDAVASVKDDLVWPAANAT
jgi:branched-chain amino acid transport system substrate-binding protein